MSRKKCTIDLFERYLFNNFGIHCLTFNLTRNLAGYSEGSSINDVSQSSTSKCFVRIKTQNQLPLSLIQWRHLRTTSTATLVRIDLDAINTVILSLVLFFKLLSSFLEVFHTNCTLRSIFEIGNKIFSLMFSLNYVQNISSRALVTHE